MDESYYASHLSAINDASKSVSAMLASDILNTRGAVVAKKNTVIDTRVVRSIAKHKLAKPLDRDILLDNGLNERKLLTLAEKTCQRVCLDKFKNDKALKEDFTRAIKEFCVSSLAMQKLTVMFFRFSDTFHADLLVALLSLGISRELGLDEEQKNNIVSAVLLSNAGILHLPQQLSPEREFYSLSDIQLLKAYIAIAKNIADLIPHSSKQIGKIILDHKERADGFGYPKGKTVDKLGIESQVIAMANDVVEAYERLVTKKTHSWNGVVDAIRVPNSAHAPELRNAALRFLMKINVPKKMQYTPEEIPLVVNRLKVKHSRLNEWFKFIQELLELHKVELKENTDFKPFTLLYTLDNTMVVSGLISEHQLSWLNSLKPPFEEDECIDIAQHELKLGEIEKQCWFVMKKLTDMREEFSRRFDSSELTDHYFTELMEVLNAE
jgi:HD-GYP domain-containing protein (c-di-GMP phosphodiesterase class II)